MTDLLWIVVVVFLIAAFGVLTGSARGRDDRTRRRWESAFYAESHKQTRTDATGVLMCRICGTSAPERAGRCPSCGATL